MRKGIILAGGAGSRLFPLTAATSKQLLPLYDKPLVYYPLSTLMLAGIQEILIISTPRDTPILQNLLGNGAHLGLRLEYIVQQNPNGLPEAFVLAESFLAGSPVAMILGDNFYHGQGLSKLLEEQSKSHRNSVFVYRVEDPKRFGVAEIDHNGKIISVEEKPEKPKSNWAITGLYFFDDTVSERAAALKPSARGETEIVDLIKLYLSENSLDAVQFPRGYAWFDAGTPQSLLRASNYVEVIQERQGIYISAPEEVSLRMGFVSDAKFRGNAHNMPNSKYKEYLERTLHECL